MTDKAKLTDEERKEIRAARWTAARKGLKHSLLMGAGLGAVNGGISKVVDRKNVSALKEMSSNYDAMDGAINNMFRPSSPRQAEHRVFIPRDIGVGLHNQKHDIRTAKKSISNDIRDIESSSNKRALKTTVGSGLGLATLGAITHGYIGGKQKQKEIMERRSKNMDKTAARRRINVKKTYTLGFKVKKYNDIVDNIAKRDYHEPSNFSYEGPKTNMNNLPTRGHFNKYIANMTRLGDDSLHKGDEKAKAYYRNKAKFERREYGEDKKYIPPSRPRYEKAKQREDAEARLRAATQERIGKPDTSNKSPKKPSLNINRDSEAKIPKLPKKESAGRGLGPGESSTIRGLNVKRLSSKELQQRAESNPRIMKHVNDTNVYSHSKGTGNEDERAMGSAEEARNSRDNAERSRESSGNTSHYKTEPFQIRDLPSSSEGKGLTRGQKIGLGVAGAGAAIYGAHRLKKYLKNRKERRLETNRNTNGDE